MQMFAQDTNSDYARKKACESQEDNWAFCLGYVAVTAQVL
jgi:hypothetical protein